MFSGLSVCYNNIDHACPQKLWSCRYMLLDTYSKSDRLFLITCNIGGASLCEAYTQFLHESLFLPRTHW